MYKEPTLTIRGTPGIVQHEVLNNKRHVLTKVIMVFSFCVTVPYMLILSFILM
jgi:hypothetical protein